MSQYSQAQIKNQNSLKDTLGKTYDSIKDNSLVLDVGCSTGYFGEMLISGKKCVVDGIEYDKKDAQAAKKSLRNVYSFDLDSEVWPEKLLKEKYDTIFFGDVLEHLKDPTTVLKKFKRLLKPKGNVIISIPNIAHISIRLELLSGNFEYEKLGILDETHLKYFTYKSFTRLLANAGYKILITDQSTVPLPRIEVEELLKKNGLIGTEKFYTTAIQPDATAFQYKFVATPANNIKIPKLSTKPLNLAPEYTTKTISLINKVSKLEDLLKYKEEELNGVLNSRSWKITKPLRQMTKNSKQKQKNNG